MSGGTQFTVGGFTFAVKPLGYKKSLEGLSILADGLLPTIKNAADALKLLDGAAESVEGKFFESLGLSIKQLPQLCELFEPVSTVQLPPSNAWVPLEGSSEGVFGKRPTLVLAWLTECLISEYGDFLSESGRKILGETGNRFTSLLKSAGKSGDSQQTPA